MLYDVGPRVQPNFGYTYKHLMIHYRSYDAIRLSSDLWPSDSAPGL